MSLNSFVAAAVLAANRPLPACPIPHAGIGQAVGSAENMLHTCVNAFRHCAEVWATSTTAFVPKYAVGAHCYDLTGSPAKTQVGDLVWQREQGSAMLVTISKFPRPARLRGQLGEKIGNRGPA